MATEDEGLGPADLREARLRALRGARVTPLVASDALTERCGGRSKSSFGCTGSM